MNSEAELPPFENEAEEAQWWFDHRDEHDARLSRAISDGSAHRVVDVLLEHGLVLEGLREVAVPIKEEDAERARRQADVAGMDYHEYMGKLLHEALANSDAA
jgi:predicted DNA binding CopG/RHH family protein